MDKQIYLICQGTQGVPVYLFHGEQRTSNGPVEFFSKPFGVDLKCHGRIVYKLTLSTLLEGQKILTVQGLTDDGKGFDPVKSDIKYLDQFTCGASIFHIATSDDLKMA